MHNIYTDIAVSTTTALIIAVAITAILRMIVHIRKHIKENEPRRKRLAAKLKLNQQYGKRTQAPSSLPVLHNYGNPCARGCTECN